MMYQQVIARRYAKGLMLAARDAELDSLEAELKSLVDVLLGTHSELFKLLDDPAFSPIERKAVLSRIKDTFAMNQVLYYFLVLLIDKGRTMLLPLIHEALVLLIDERRGRVRAHIKSATPIDNKLVNEIKDALAKVCKKEVLTDATIAPELLGGIRVEMGGLIFDGTVKAKLAAIKNKLFYEVGTI